MKRTSEMMKLQYGRKGLIKGIINKLRGKDLLNGFNQYDRSITTEFLNKALSVWENQQNELTRQEQEEKIVSFEKTFNFNYNAYLQCSYKVA